MCGQKRRHGATGAPRSAIKEEEGTPLLEELDALYAARISQTPVRGTNPLSAEPVATDSGLEEVGLGFYKRTQKPRAGEFKHMSHELSDIVRICTKAHRAKHGDLVWLTWDGGGGGNKGRVSHPAHASTLIGITVAGAHALRRCWEASMKRYHFDCALIEALKDEVFRHNLHACFLYPSVGHYNTHHSSILHEERQASWNKTAVQEGTRPFKEGHAQRALHELCAKGHAPALCTVQLPEEEPEDLTWLTHRPEEDPSAADEPVASAAGGSGLASKKRCRPFQQFGMPNPTKHQLQYPEPPQTKRRQRQLRGNKVLYAHRTFTSDLKKARLFFEFKKGLFVNCDHAMFASVEADVGAQLEQWVGDPTQPGDPMRSAYGFRQPLPKRKTPTAKGPIAEELGPGVPGASISSYNPRPQPPTRPQLQHQSLQMSLSPLVPPPISQIHEEPPPLRAPNTPPFNVFGQAAAAAAGDRSESEEPSQYRQSRLWREQQ